ncbi:MAG: GIY-YIG nuclease family protein [Melioribacteraceae bacterium]|nr:GIY-YIG nuclease family protein [Melioribacteraceae bacterium]MCF8266219.1 GIY-YIG nuclease family protein [Melioribacteraceae bacterium]
MFFVYVLRSLNYDRIYIGHTHNLENRIIEHNSGRTKSTKPYKPWELVYSENYESRDEAVRREKYLKTGSGRELIKSFF